MGTEQLFQELNAGDGNQVAKRAADATASEQASRGFLGEAWESFKYSAAQAPVHGITQLVDGAFGTDWTKASTFMDAPKEAKDFGGWHAQQIGGALGMVPLFAAANFGVHKGMNRLLAARGMQTAESVGMMSMQRAVAETAMAGAIYEGVFMPSAPGESLLAGRLKNATHGALTFGSLTASARLLHDYGLIKNRIGIGVASGIPAGIVSAQSDSLLHGRGFAGFDETAKHAYTFAMVGGVLSAVHSIPLGERGKTTTGEKSAENRVANATGEGTIQPTEFKVMTEQGRLALEAFRKGEQPTAWAEVQRAGEPKRTLFVQHDGTKLPYEIGTRAELIACCNLPEISPFSRKLVLPGATDKPMFMDVNGERVRFSTERTGPESVELSDYSKRTEAGAERGKRLKTLLDREGINPESLPNWMKEFEPTGQVWRGDNAIVFELAPREGFPEVVLKIKRSDFEGQRWWEADIYNRKGEIDPTAVHETNNKGSEEPLYIFLEDRVDYNHPDSSGFDTLMQKLDSKGLQISDPGSGPPVGRSRNTGEWVVADRDAVSKKGSGEHEVERAMSLGAEEYQRVREAEEKAAQDRWDDGFGEFDATVAAAQQAAVRGFKLAPEYLPEAKKVFGTETPEAAVKSLIEQMTDGISSKADVHIMQTYAYANGNEAAATAQMRFVARMLKSTNLQGRNDWVDRLAR